MAFLPNFVRRSIYGDEQAGIYPATRVENLGTPTTDFLYSQIHKWRSSEEYQTMIAARKYYYNKNKVTEEKERFYIDRNGTKVKDLKLSNIKLSHPFLRKLIKQKVNYLLGKEPSFSTRDEVLAENLTKYIDKPFLSRIKTMGRDAIMDGIAWLYVYYSSQGILSFKRMPATEVIPYWEDEDHSQLEAILRFYSELVLSREGNEETVLKVEFHTALGVWYFEEAEKGLIPDRTKGGDIQGYFVAPQAIRDEAGNPIEGEDGSMVIKDEEMVWGVLPWIPFRYNEEELSLLALVQSLIDEYDYTTSETGDTLHDFPSNIKVVRNYDGTNKDEFTQNINTFRVAFVEGDGDMKVLDTKLDTQAAENHLSRLRKDIYEAASGVDTQEVSLGNASGEALKFRYADLSMDMDGMAAEFAEGLSRVIWFIVQDMKSMGYAEITGEVEIAFNTDSIINESQTITDCKNSQGMISQRTVLNNHPYVRDVDQELKSIEEERQREQDDVIALQKRMNAELDGSGYGTASGAVEAEGE